MARGYMTITFDGGETVSVRKIRGRQKTLRNKRDRLATYPRGVGATRSMLNQIRKDIKEYENSHIRSPIADLMEFGEWGAKELAETLNVSVPYVEKSHHMFYKKVEENEVC